MKAIVVHEYGGPNVLKFEDYADPAIKPDEVLIRVTATSINPIDLKRRSGAAKALFPIQFPGILGLDVSGTIAKLGTAVTGWKVGDTALAFADHTYAELCAVAASSLSKVPQGMELADAAALPTVLTTGSQLITVGTGIKAGQTVLVTGATGNVGRTAVFTAKQRGARVIAGVLKKHLDDAASLGVDSAVATDDDAALAKLPPLDAVADTVDGQTAQKLLAKVKNGGVFASVLGPPANAKDFPSVKIVPVKSKPDADALDRLSQAVQDGKLTIPISRSFALKDAAAAHAAVEAGLKGKVLLLA
jgi:NADPH:quinone reductase-like Zn-dependent oxidoreductase